MVKQRRLPISADTSLVYRTFKQDAALTMKCIRVNNAWHHGPDIGGL